MKWFKQKVEKEKDVNENDTDFNKAKYKIVLHEKLGGTVREITDFEAFRWIDAEDNVVYLKNDKKKFLEIFPQQMQDFKNYTREEVDDLLDRYSDKLKRERKNDSDEVNDKDIEYEILKLKAKQRSFINKLDASYLSFDKKGKPTFNFLREGSTFFPFKWDTDTNTIFVPSDNRKKSASIALRNKEAKYNTQKIVAGMMVLLLVIQLVALVATGWGYLKITNMEKELFIAYDESAIAAAKRACLEDVGAVSKVVKDNALEVNSIVESVKDELNKPQTIVQGSVLE